ncbi:hypothetical protein WJS89_11395 [Sphingomicrobium sp. XHP0235]|uniref:hypothetical protein n=1 Tax=Sphingomicrobium aquimarinum TaxID=3133971 RepID=UPI0031FE9835
MAKLYDARTRNLHYQRALASGPATFLQDRCLDDILDRLASMSRTFRHILLVGGFASSAMRALEPMGARIDHLLPAHGDLSDIHGTPIAYDPGTFDLIIVLGALDTLNGLEEALLRLRFLLKPDSPMLGVVPGGDTLATLRRALLDLDARTGVTSPRAHPRIDPAGLTQLLASAGFRMPVVDVDRLVLRYSGLTDLVRDLRAMAATNCLAERSKSYLGREAMDFLQHRFAAERREGKTPERLDLLHFIGWSGETG